MNYNVLFIFLQEKPKFSFVILEQTIVGHVSKKVFLNTRLKSHAGRPVSLAVEGWRTKG